MSILHILRNNFSTIRDPHDKYIISHLSLDKLSPSDDYNVDFNISSFSQIIYITFYTLLHDKDNDISFYDIHTKLDILTEYSHIHREDKHIHMLHEVINTIEDMNTSMYNKQEEILKWKGHKKGLLQYLQLLA